MIKLNAHAKLNLALDITGKRADGYHELDTVMQSLSLCDTVTIKKAHGIHVTMDSGGVDMQNNTAYRAALSFSEHTGIAGADIRIEKRIPTQSGLGGASADAAAVLIGLNRLYSAGLEPEELAGIGVRIGADVPFALLGGTARARGVGEVLRPLRPAVPMHYVIVKPHAGISTAEAFRRYKKAAPLRMETVEYAVLKGDIPLFLRYTGNALGMAALSISPEILHAAEALMAAGAPRALMSGSGSSMFAPFSTLEEAQSAASRVKGKFAFISVCGSCETGVTIIEEDK